jgi:hypothetical protein
LERGGGGGGIGEEKGKINTLFSFGACMQTLAKGRRARGNLFDPCNHFPRINIKTPVMAFDSIRPDMMGNGKCFLHNPPGHFSAA